VRAATLALACALPLSGGCVREPQAEARERLVRDLERFEAAVRDATCARPHSAVALAAGTERLAWGAALGAPSERRAKALALARCRMRAREAGVVAPCHLYLAGGYVLTVDGE